MALIVEDGNINTSPPSEVYISVADADTYFSKFGAPDAWDNASATEKEVALRNATKELDQMVLWQSSIVKEEQPLAWPREKFTDATGRTVENDEIPETLRQANAELASYFIENDWREGSEPAVTSESLGRASITYAGKHSPGPIKAIRKSLLRYGAPRGSIVEVYRA